MYTRALEGYTKALGEDHTSTLDTVNNLGNLYRAQGKLDKAETMYTQALKGYTKAVGPEVISTYVPALNTLWALGSLSDSLGCVENARAWYSKALWGYEKVFGERHTKCQPLRDNLTALDEAEDDGDISCETAVQEQARRKGVKGPGHVQPKLTSRRHNVLKKLGWKRT